MKTRLIEHLYIFLFLLVISEASLAEERDVENVLLLQKKAPERRVLHSSMIGADGNQSIQAPEMNFDHRRRIPENNDDRKNIISDITDERDLQFLFGSPSAKPTRFPTPNPTSSPSCRPSMYPTHKPTKSPIRSPTSKPTRTKNFGPNDGSPSTFPSEFPSMFPSSFPSSIPSVFPSAFPSIGPTKTGGKRVPQKPYVRCMEDESMKGSKGSGSKFGTGTSKRSSKGTSKSSSKSSKSGQNPFTIRDESWTSEIRSDGVSVVHTYFSTIILVCCAVTSIAVFM